MKRSHDIKRMFVSAFKDKNGSAIKEGDIIKEIIIEKKQSYHYEEKFDMMGNMVIVKIIDREEEIVGWCERVIKWAGDCLIAKLIKDSGNVSPVIDFRYLNNVYDSSSVEIIGNIYSA